MYGFPTKVFLTDKFNKTLMKYMTASENGILQEIKKEHIDDVFEELSDDIITAWEPIRVKLSLTLVKQRSPTATKEFVNKLHRFFTSRTNEDVIITESLLHLMSTYSIQETEKISQCNRLLQHLDATGANCALKKFDCFFCGEKSYSNFRMIVHKCEQHEMNIDEPKMRSKAKCKQELLLAVDVIIYQSVKSSHSSSTCTLL
ncbi:putative nicotinate-nucleotide adenylyltransferase [Trichinella spiralis]|uniref:Nicotinate-nucleotide adenylyltransferase n=1 Tax=Trichinella spiralis TaxID=6334 RepID=A0ABR3KNW6_TRISP